MISFAPLAFMYALVFPYMTLLKAFLLLCIIANALHRTCTVALPYGQNCLPFPHEPLTLSNINCQLFQYPGFCSVGAIALFAFISASGMGHSRSVSVTTFPLASSIADTSLPVRFNSVHRLPSTWNS